MTQRRRLTALAVDDDPKVIEAIRLSLGRAYEIVPAASADEALETLARRKADLIFLDLHFPGGMDGLEALRRIKDSGERAPVIMVTASDTAKTAVEAMKRGAFDYLTKPFDPEELSVVAEKALAAKSLEDEVIYLRSQAPLPTPFESLLGRSAAMAEVCALAAKAAQTDVTVLLEGESGTGKELMSKAIHDNGPRRGKPFVAINCAGIPDQLLEAELFGYERGAFTGADRQKPGKFELADGGTLFLDEIGSLRADLQGKILRVLQDRTFERLGGVKTLRVDVRLISATNIDLAKAVREGKFREDLYYRLRVVPLRLPPLRDRGEDIPLLARHFLEISDKRFRKNVKGFTSKAMDYLVRYPWPGNVRELENLIERLVVLADKEVIDACDLPFDIFLKGQHNLEASWSESLILRDAVHRFEKQFITAALERTHWNQTETAKLLGIHRNTLLQKTGQLGMKKRVE